MGNPRKPPAPGGLSLGPENVLISANGAYGTFFPTTTDYSRRDMRRSTSMTTLSVPKSRAALRQPITLVTNWTAELKK